MQKEYSLTFDLTLCLVIMTVQRGQRPTSHVVRTSSYFTPGLMSYPHLEKRARWCECPSFIYPSSHAPQSHCNFPPSRVSLASQVCTWICSTEMSKLVPPANGSLIRALGWAPVSWTRMTRLYNYRTRDGGEAIPGAPKILEKRGELEEC